MSGKRKRINKCQFTTDADSVRYTKNNAKKQKNVNAKKKNNKSVNKNTFQKPPIIIKNQKIVKIEKKTNIKKMK